MKTSKSWRAYKSLKKSLLAKTVGMMTAPVKKEKRVLRPLKPLRKTQMHRLISYRRVREKRKLSKHPS